MKMYDKASLTIINGMIVCKETNDVVAIDPTIVRQANELETLSQEVDYLADQPTAQPMPSLDGFKRMSELSPVTDVFEVKTPTLNMKALETMRMMDELDAMDNAKQANDLLKNFGKLLRFVDSRFVVDTCEDIELLDTPTLGSILDLTREDVVGVVAKAAGLVDEDDEDKTSFHCKELTEDEAKEILDFLEKISD